MNEDYERFTSLPEDVQQKFWRFAYTNCVIGENLMNRAASGETMRDFIQWHSEVDSRVVELWLTLQTLTDGLIELPRREEQE